MVYTFRVERRQVRRFGWVDTARFVFIMTQAGTRRFCSQAFARRILRPFDFLLMVYSRDVWGESGGPSLRDPSGPPDIPVLLLGDELLEEFLQLGIGDLLLETPALGEGDELLFDGTGELGLRELDVRQALPGLGLEDLEEDVVDLRVHLLLAPELLLHGLLVHGLPLELLDPPPPELGELVVTHGVSR